MSSLPPEIITSILTRLPVKSLLRFRCVSKPWCSQIDSPHFINLHLSHSVTTGSNLSPITLNESKGTLYSLDSDSLESLVKFKPPFTTPHDTNLSCTCNGLLLLDHLSNSERLILYNPSTRKHLVLPTPPPNNNYADLNPYVESNFLGYDVINDDYKVFNVLEFADKADEFITSEARIYSLKSNLWHVVKDFTKEVIFDFVFEACVNGALHALNEKYHTTIVALDVGKEAFNLIPMPNLEDKNVQYFTARVFDGCLAVLCLYPGNRTDIWVMKEYGVKESWSMLLSVKLELENPDLDFFVIPMLYSKNRAEVLLSCDGDLEWYDLSRKTFRDSELSWLTVRFRKVCVESLVSVGDGTGKIDEKKHHGEEK